jgi:two-component system NarL family sensor kinase
MSRTRRSVLIAAAWAMPIAWFAVALLCGPTDGTSVSDPTAALGDDAWSSSVIVVHAYGDTPLHEGDTVLEIDGRDVDAWVTGATDASRAAGDSITYHVRRPARDLNREIDVAVPLTGYPVTDAVTRNGASLAVAAMLLAAASFAFWHRPRSPAAAAFLAGAAAIPFLLTSTPFGVGAINLAGSRGVWPQLVGELVCAVGIGALLLSAVALAAPAGWLRRHGWAVALAFAIPVAGYAAWLLAFAVGRDASAARLQTIATVAAPALVATFPVIVAVLLGGYLRAREREDRLALRLVLLAVIGGVAVRVLFIDLPARLGDQPLVPWDLLALLLVPAVLTCFVVALLHYRLDDIEPTVRRALVQALVATIVGAVFVGVASAVNITSDVSFDAMVPGGVVALLLLPVAVALQRVVRRLVYGDRELPHRIVSELRALDPLT